MENKIKAIKMFMLVRGYARVKVVGASMYPILQDGELIEIVSDHVYEIGEILVYSFETEGILVHRLLKKEKERYLCKGDNAFRIESITEQQIIGKVKQSEDVHKNIEFINCSLHIGYLFEQYYDVEKVKQQPEYIAYHHKYLRSGENSL